MLLNNDNEVLHVYGDVSAYVSVRQGDMSYDIARLVSAQVSAAIASLSRLADKTGKSVKSAPLHCVTEDKVCPVSLHLTPLETAPSGEKMRILSFLTADQQSYGVALAEPHMQTLDDLNETRFVALQQELLETRESLRNTIEELETSNEELQATNEELLASNEELQSTNEELQSVNEELYTVNSEYQEKIRILDRLNNDLDAMAQATGIPTVFLDDQLNISRFTPSVSGIFELRDADIGRPLSDFSNKIGYANLITDAEKALTTAKLHELVWETDEGKLIIRHVPYIDAITKKTALVLMFLDVSSLDRLDFLQTVLDSLPEHIVVLDGDGHIRLVNEAWTNFARENEGELHSIGVGAQYLSACRVSPQSRDFDTATEVETNLRRMLDGEIDVFSVEYPCHSKKEQRWFLMHAKRFAANRSGLVISHINTTSWHRSPAAVSSGSDTSEATHSNE
ncbi:MULTISPECIES: PAS domain-containing protein [unclassified Roseibium]|uniref:PAS domain-containing protein n=1 Tax=unclassified Roseibium TaxID=2629323 RepID=UPI00273EDA59|nr:MULTISPECIES: PAS domain-containing protein [unclassified Roseibium]